MSHKCAEAGCGFHLPDAYPLPWCPWHIPLEKMKAVGVVAGVVLLGVGYGVSAGVEALKQRKQRNAVREGQEQWRKRKSSIPNPGESDTSASSEPYSDAG
jgi:hypothetical protein